MKVILTSRIKTLGEVGDIKTVADGYGKNYLLPKKLALIYSKENYKIFEEKKKMIEIEDLANRKTAEDLRIKIEKMDFVLLEGAGDNDRLYGSVSTTKLAKFVNDFLKEKAVIRSEILIKEPIKTLGKFQVTFNLHPDVSLEKDIIVARSKEEAEKIKKGEFIKKEEKKIPDNDNYQEFLKEKKDGDENKKEKETTKDKQN